jgi:hypothetical protein
MQTSNIVEFPHKSASFLIAMELESALRTEQNTTFRRHFSVGDVSSSLTDGMELDRFESSVIA